MVIQLVPLNIVKDGGMFWCGLRKKSVSYNSYNSDGSSGPRILNGVLSSFIDKCRYLSWWKRNGNGYSLSASGRSNSTEQMTQNRTFRNPRINKSAKSRLSGMYVVLVSCFYSILHQEAKTEGDYALNLRLLLFFDIVRMWLWKCMKEMSQVLLFAEVIL